MLEVKNEIPEVVFIEDSQFDLIYIESSDEETMMFADDVNENIPPVEDKPETTLIISESKIDNDDDQNESIGTLIRQSSALYVPSQFNTESVSLVLENTPSSP